MARIVEKTIGGDDTFTDALEVSGDFNISVSGTWGGTVTVQRSFDLGATWVDVEAFTANTEKAGIEAEGGIRYRAGIKASEYTSGNAVVRIGY